MSLFDSLQKTNQELYQMSGATSSVDDLIEQCEALGIDLDAELLHAQTLTSICQAEGSEGYEEMLAEFKEGLKDSFPEYVVTVDSLANWEVKDPETNEAVLARVEGQLAARRANKSLRDKGITVDTEDKRRAVILGGMAMANGNHKSPTHRLPRKKLRLSKKFHTIDRRATKAKRKQKHKGKK